MNGEEARRTGFAKGRLPKPCSGHSLFSYCLPDLSGGVQSYTRIVLNALECPASYWAKERAPLKKLDNFILTSFPRGITPQDSRSISLSTLSALLRAPQTDSEHLPLLTITSVFLNNGLLRPRRPVSFDLPT